MRLLTWIDERPEPVLNANPEALPPVFKVLLWEQLSLPLATNDQEALSRLRIARKIKDAIGAVELEDADFSFLVTICRENKWKWLAHFHGQVLEKLEMTKAKE